MIKIWDNFENKLSRFFVIVGSKEIIHIMEYALDILTEKLLLTGMTRKEIDHLLARFLEEEAFNYVDYIETELRNRKSESGNTLIS